MNVSRPPAAPGSSSSDDLLGRRRRGFFAREREQVVRQLGKPLGVGLEIGDERRRRAVPRKVRDVAAQRGQRRAQLVRRVGQEAPLRFARTLERVEHGVQRRREPPDLVVPVRVGQRRRASPVRPISAAARSRRTSGRSAPRIRSATASAADRRSHERGEQRQRAQVRTVSATSAVDAATSTAPPPATSASGAA